MGHGKWLPHALLHLRDEADEMWNLRDALWTLIRRFEGGAASGTRQQKEFSPIGRMKRVLVFQVSSRTLVIRVEDLFWQTNLKFIWIKMESEFDTAPSNSKTLHQLLDQRFVVCCLFVPPLKKTRVKMMIPNSWWRTRVIRSFPTNTSPINLDERKAASSVEKPITFNLHSGKLT